MSGAGVLRIGTRASALALWQAREVASRIAAQPGAPRVELVHIHTSGDLQSEVPLWQTRGRAFFTREIDRALLDGEVDVAVHSLKDLPTQLDAGLALAALLPRADPRDVLVSRTGAALAALPAGARIGTSSLRRRAFLARLRPDATLLELRGNVPTRIERLQRGEYDAIVLAAAGLVRLDLAQHITEYLPAESFPPAGSAASVAPPRPTSASRGSARGRSAASSSPASSCVGRSFRLCTATSTLPSRSARSISRVKNACPRTCHRGRSVCSSPEVRMCTSSTGGASG